MGIRSANDSATLSEQAAATELGTRPREHDQSLAELYYRGFLEDLAVSADPGKLAKFIEEVFTADPRLLSDSQKMSLAASLADWAATQPREVKTCVWRSLGCCAWVRPMLGVVGKLAKEKRKSLLEIDPDSHADLIAPWMGDRPGRVLPMAKLSKASPTPNATGSASQPHV